MIVLKPQPQLLPQAKIVTVQRQDLLRFDRVERPIRKLYLDLLHSTIACLFDNFCPSNQSEHFKRRIERMLRRMGPNAWRRFTSGNEL